MGEVAARRGIDPPSQKYSSFTVGNDWCISEHVTRIDSKTGAG